MVCQERGQRLEKRWFWAQKTKRGKCVAEGCCIQTAKKLEKATSGGDGLLALSVVPDGSILDLAEGGKLPGVSQRLAGQVGALAPLSLARFERRQRGRVPQQVPNTGYSDRPSNFGGKRSALWHVHAFVGALETGDWGAGAQCDSPAG